MSEVVMMRWASDRVLYGDWRRVEIDNRRKRISKAQLHCREALEKHLPIDNDYTLGDLESGSKDHKVAL
jgi:hypothetical protein